MTDNERELLDMIRNHKNPEEALKGAISVILAYLSQHESSEAPSFSVPQESA